MGISRDSRHKRSATGAKRAYYRKKRYTYRRICKHETLLTKAELLKKVVSRPTPVLGPSASISSASVAATVNSALYASILGISPGAQRASPARCALSACPSILPTTNSSVRTPSRNPPSSKSTLHPSDNGTRHTTGRVWGGDVSRSRPLRASRTRRARAWRRNRRLG